MTPAVAPDGTTGSPAPRKRGKATPETICVGCMAMVEKEGKHRRAEILGIKETKSGKQFYCNFDNFNKRLDEWVPSTRIDFEHDVEWPSAEKNEKSKKVAPRQQPTKAQSKASRKAIKVPAQTREASVTSGSSRHGTPALDGEGDTVMVMDLDGDDDGAAGGESATAEEAHADANAALTETQEEFSREQEISRLRLGGSMTQNQAEISRIRNISQVQFGKFDLSPWYFSPYPEEFTQEDLMYICEFCLCYYGDVKSFSRHRAKCTIQHPPGNEIYRDDYVSFFEIDGKRQRTWCRNLCLLSKMFLDHKTLYYDVDPFLFYCMTSRDEKGCHLVGYFSKEKESADGYNVACILTLPQYQRKGYGRLLIQFSYELSKIENKLGSPEKPLSDLGLLSYRQFWKEGIMDILMDINEKEERLSMDGLATRLAMTLLDVENTLKFLDILVYHKGEHKMIMPTKLIEQHQALKEKELTKPKRVIEPKKIQWKPPVFNAASRTWGW